MLTVGLLLEDLELPISKSLLLVLARIWGWTTRVTYSNCWNVFWGENKGYQLVLS